MNLVGPGNRKYLDRRFLLAPDRHGNPPSLRVHPFFPRILD